MWKWSSVIDSGLVGLNEFFVHHFHRGLNSGRGHVRAEDALGTPTQSRVPPSILYYTKIFGCGHRYVGVVIGVWSSKCWPGRPVLVQVCFPCGEHSENTKALFPHGKHPFLLLQSQREFFKLRRQEHGVPRFRSFKF